MRDVSVIEINLTHLDHNMRVLRRIVGEACGICPIVKADAYGLGAARIAKRLAYDGADLLAVYTPEQAAELFRAAIGCRVLVLMPVRDIGRTDELYRGLVSDRLQLTVHDADHVSDLIAITERYGATINVHLEIDTGMSRGGCPPTEAPAILRQIASCRRLNLAGIFTHFASADSDPDFTAKQMTDFDLLLAEHKSLIPKDCRIHVASTFAALRHQRFHKTMIRIGLAWAGYGLDCLDTGGEVISEAQHLKPILSWKSRIVQIKSIAPGTPVGYGSRWTAPSRGGRPSIIGLVPVGYADGYPIGVGGGVGGGATDEDSGGAKGGGREANVGGGAVVGVFINPHDERPSGPPVFAPVIGAVNMDQITIDLTDVVEAISDQRSAIGGQHSAPSTQHSALSTRLVGALVELISPDVAAPNHLPKLASLAGTIPHELLCRLNPRLKRTYIAPPTTTTPPAATAESEPATAAASR